MKTKRDNLSLGPFFTKVKTAKPAGSLVDPAGFAMEWSTARKNSTIEVFEYFPKHLVERTRIENLVVREKDVPISFDCSELHVIGTPQGTFVSLEAVLFALYDQRLVSRPIVEVLRDLADHVTFYSYASTTVTGEGLLAPEAESRGFQLWSIIPTYGTVNVITGESTSFSQEFSAGIGWRPGNKGCYLFAGAVLCTFSAGSKAPPRCVWASNCHPGVAPLLEQELRRIVPGEPINLFTAGGLETIDSLRKATQEAARALIEGPKGARRE